VPFSNLQQPVYLPLHLLQCIKPLADGASLCADSAPLTDEVEVAKQSVLNRYGVEAVCVLFMVDAGKVVVHIFNLIFPEGLIKLICSDVKVRLVRLIFISIHAVLQTLSLTVRTLKLNDILLLLTVPCVNNCEGYRFPLKRST
jgi:hypothetical protein